MKKISHFKGGGGVDHVSQSERNMPDKGAEIGFAPSHFPVCPTLSRMQGV